jgi:hypothetical protein
MRFYTRQHRHYCGVDLHARTMYLCVLNQAGEILLEENLRCDPQLFLRAIAPFRDDMVVAVECIFTWTVRGNRCVSRPPRKLVFRLRRPVGLSTRREHRPPSLYKCLVRFRKPDPEIGNEDRDREETTPAPKEEQKQTRERCAY